LSADLLPPPKGAVISAFWPMHYKLIEPHSLRVSRPYGGQMDDALPEWLQEMSEVDLLALDPLEMSDAVADFLLARALINLARGLSAERSIEVAVATFREKMAHKPKNLADYFRRRKATR